MEVETPAAPSSGATRTGWAGGKLDKTYSTINLGLRLIVGYSLDRTFTPPVPGGLKIQPLFADGSLAQLVKLSVTSM